MTFADRLPRHNCSLSLTHNEYKTFYLSIADYLAEEHIRDCFKDEEAKRRSIETGEVWELVWYPDNPVGFFKVAAPTLSELLDLANEVEKR